NPRFSLDGRRAKDAEAPHRAVIANEERYAVRISYGGDAGRIVRVAGDRPKLCLLPNRICGMCWVLECADDAGASEKGEKCLAHFGCSLGCGRSAFASSCRLMRTNISQNKISVKKKIRFD